MDLVLKVATRYREKVARFEAMAPAGSVGVDSGSLVVIDPAYLKYWGTGEHPELSYDSVMNAGPVTQLHFNSGSPAAVLISNFGGDGSYQVFRELSGENGTGSFAVDFLPRLIQRVAARYKKKMVSDKGNPVYLYSERQIARRNAEKAKRLEGLSSNISKVRAQVKKDLQSSDRDRSLTALAVALIDETYERVGNEESAGEGHFGVTGWKKTHISFGKGGAKIKYVGKSGVKHEKTVSSKALVSALRDAYEACEGCLFEHKDGKVDASKVNAYLKQFDITAKDLRGFHANTLMKEHLRAARKGKLSEDKKEREKLLKSEFKKALEATAEAVGHEPSTLKSQYLVPGLAEQYLKDGTILDKMVKKADEDVPHRVAARYLEAKVGPEAPFGAPFGRWAWTSHRKGLPNEPEEQEPDTELEREVYAQVRKHFASDRVGLPKETAELLASCVGHGWYKPVLHAPPYDTLYRGLKITKMGVLEKMIGEELSHGVEGAVDFNEPQSVFLVDAEGEPDNGYSSSWSAKKQITRDFSDNGKRGWAVTLFANTADNPNRFLAGPGGLYNVDGLSRWHLEKETVGLEPVLVRRIEWKPLGGMAEKVADSTTDTFIDVAWVVKMRKDFLALMKNLPRVHDYETAATLRKAFATYRENFNEFFFLHFLKNTEVSPAIRSILSKVGWDFYIELTLPLAQPNEYYSEAARFAEFKQEFKPWESRLRTRAQAFWRKLNDILETRTDQRIVVKVPTKDRLVLEGFQADVVGYNPDDEFDRKALERFKEGLRIYKRHASQVLPILIKRQLPLVVDFTASIDEGGRYERTYIVISPTAGSSVDKPQIVAKTMAHEMGHHIFSMLSSGAEEFWNEAVHADRTDLDLGELLTEWPVSMRYASDFVDHMAMKDALLALQVDVLSWGHGGGSWRDRGDFQAAYDRGERSVTVPKSPVSGYGGKNPEEAFCEAIGHLVAYGPMAVLPIVKHWLNIILPGEIKTGSSQMARQVAARVTRSGGAKLVSG
jgi:DNA topoisomerase-1